MVGNLCNTQPPNLFKMQVHRSHTGRAIRPGRHGQRRAILWGLHCFLKCWSRDAHLIAIFNLLPWWPFLCETCAPAFYRDLGAGYWFAIPSPQISKNAGAQVSHRKGHQARQAWPKKGHLVGLALLFEMLVRSLQRAQKRRNLVEKNSELPADSLRSSGPPQVSPHTGRSELLKKGRLARENPDSLKSSDF